MNVLKTYSVLLLLLLLSCKKKEIGPQQIDESQFESTSPQVIVGCEGNFGWGNGSISSYNPVNNTITNNAFKAVNGFALGDVVQSITEIDDKLYVVVNNSSKIVVIDKSSLKYITEINGFTSPRYIQLVAPNKAYVTDLYANKVSVVNTTDNTIVSKLSVGGWTENILVFGNKAFISVANSNKIVVIDTSNEKILGEIMVGESPSGLVMDKYNKLWVLTSGGLEKELAQLHQISPINLTIEKTFIFNDIAMSPNSLRIDRNKEKLYYLNNGVFEFAISSLQLNEKAIIEKNNHLFYGLGVDPNSNEIYITDAIDYVQNGWLFRYSTLGTLIDSIQTGIIPQHIQFINK